MMDPPKILLEASFMHAVIDAAHERHEESVAIYLELVQQYEAEQVLLVAVGDHLRELRGRSRRGPLAPVDPLHVGFQHRRAAARTVGRTDIADLRHALTLVMCDRHRVRRVATHDPSFDRYELQLTPERG